MEKDIRKTMKDIKDKVKSRSIYIARVSENSKIQFMDLANSEFESDYGMCMKFLMDLYKGCFPTGHEMIETEIEMLKSRVGKIEENLEVKPAKTIKMVSGKEIKLKRREKNGNI